MKRYYFRIYQCGDPDGSNVWVDATSESEAKSEIMSEYHSIDRIELIQSEKL